jgi:hypothetical protein
VPIVQNFNLLVAIVYFYKTIQFDDEEACNAELMDVLCRVVGTLLSPLVLNVHFKQLGTLLSAPRA